MHAPRTTTKRYSHINQQAQKAPPALWVLHHSAKGTSTAQELTLENILRGTGDLGAMCDVVWSLQHDRGIKGDGEEYADESRLLTRVFIKCVKARDFTPADPFVLQGRPHIDERGDFAVLDKADVPSEFRRTSRLLEMVRAGHDDF